MSVRWGRFFLFPISSLTNERARGVTVDYILVFVGNVEIALNPNEVDDTKFVTIDELSRLLSEERGTMTPWFLEISKRFLFSWWRALLEEQPVDASGAKRRLQPLQDLEIHRAF